MPFNPSSADQLKKLTGDLAKIFNNPNAKLSDKGVQQVFLNTLKAFDAEAQSVIADLSDELGEPRDEVGFAEFLSDIGNSVVETQRKLDQQSLDYLNQTKGEKHVTPTIYRLPKVSASIKFGMRKSDKKGFNIIVAQRSKEEEQMLNQSLDFEIISVPPPPDYQRGLAAEMPEAGFIFPPDARAAIFSAVENYKARVDEDQEEVRLRRTKILKSQNQVLILHLRPRREAGKDDFLLLLGDPVNKENVGVWYLQTDPADPANTKFEMILRFNASGRIGEQYDLLRKIVLTYSKKQAPFLR